MRSAGGKAAARARRSAGVTKPGKVSSGESGGIGTTGRREPVSRLLSGLAGRTLALVVGADPVDPEPGSVGALPVFGTARAWGAGTG